MAKISMPDGQELEYPDDIAGDDQMLKDALSPFAPDVRNAELKRTNKNGVMCVQVIKKAGTKGGIICDDLAAADESINSAIAMRRKLEGLESEGKLDVRTLLLMKGEIEKAVDAGEREIRHVEDALRSLKQSDAVASTKTPVGF
ncbi:MAG TPA: hypothetical protein VF747_17760 [Blastocatellia bacterium]|jgi:hypothetical protein